MIVLVSKYNPATGKVENARRDLSAEECEDMICGYRAVDISCTKLPYDPHRLGSEFYKVLAAARCRKEDPVVLEGQGTVAKYAFRGTVICCGVGTDGEDTDIKEGFLADEYPIEPAYGDDAICIPSLAEWLAIPERKRKILSAGFWCWTRDINDGIATTITSEREYISFDMSNTNGGVVSFVDLRRLPSDVADKIRTGGEPVTNANTGEVLEDTVYFEKIDGTSRQFMLVKITKDIYGIRAEGRNMTFGPIPDPDLGNIDADRTKTYEESRLRAQLNGDYLEQLIKYIRTH